YPPRGAALAQALGVARGRGRFGLHGALVLSGREMITIAREERAVRALCVPADGIWDGRWRAAGGQGADFTLRMLGEAGLAQMPPLPDSPLPRAALATTPAIWCGNRLIA